MVRIFTAAATLIIVLFVMTIVCTIAWQTCVTDTLYNCTDPGWLDFLSPGDWVHSHDSLTIKVVPVITFRSMSEPDTIKQGWSVARLWCLWYLFVFVSIIVSAFVARRQWHSNRASKQL